MAKKKFYAIRGENASAIFESWDTTKIEISKKEKYGKLKYKGFVTKEEALAFLKGDHPLGIFQEELLNENITYFYSDGSYRETVKDDELIKGLGYGVVMVQNLENVFEFGGRPNPKFIKSNQIGGELTAVIKIVRLINERNLIGDIAIVYDYTGVNDFITGELKPRGELSIKYSEYMKKALVHLKAKGANVSFIKVAAHSKNQFNERVDEIAASYALNEPII